MQNLKKKYNGWALITGASSGIGKEFAKELARQGFNIVLVARHEDALNKISQKLQSAYHVKTRVISADLSLEGEAQKVFDACHELDIGLLIPAAGIDEMGLFLEKDYVDLKRMLRLNIESPTELAHLFGKKMVGRGRSGIIFISSLFAYQGIPHFSAYAASKAYILTLGEALSYEFRKQGIDVLTVSPGLTSTPFAEGLKLNATLLPVLAQKPNAVARLGIGRIGKKATVVSGLLNKFYAWENRLIPRSWPVHLFGFLIGNAVRSYNKKHK